MLLVVRHADAGDKGSWEGPDLLRPLSPAGRRQAEGLVVRLEDFPVERILSSPTLRHAVLCTHGEAIGRLLTQLQADGLVVEGPLDWPKGSTWLLQRTDRGQVRGRLLAPLQLEVSRAR